MIRKPQCNTVVSSLVMLLAVPVLGSSPAHAQVVKHFKVEGGDR